MKSLFSKLLAASLVVSTLGALTVVSAETTWQHKHPRRTEVLRRDHHEMRRDRELNHEINADKGHLGGHYNQLKREDHQIAREDRHIQRQEQWDAAHNHGHITQAEQNQLNREENRVHRQENRLQNQINQDHQ